MENTEKIYELFSEVVSNIHYFEYIEEKKGIVFDLAIVAKSKENGQIVRQFENIEEMKDYYEKIKKYLKNEKI